MSEKVENEIKNGTLQKSPAIRKTKAIYISKVLYGEFKRIQEDYRNNGEIYSLGQISQKHYEESLHMRSQNLEIDLLKEDIKILQAENQNLTKLLIKNTTNPVSSDSLIKEITKLMEVMLKSQKISSISNSSPILNPPPPPNPPSPQTHLMNSMAEKHIDINKIHEIEESVKKTLEDDSQNQHQIDESLRNFLKDELELVVNTNHAIKPSKVDKKINKNSKNKMESLEDYKKRKEIRKKNKKSIKFDKKFKFYAESHPEKYKCL